MSDTPKQPEIADRLAKVIARAGLCSRRDAEGWISDGRVSVNGKKVLTPAFNVTSRDRIEVDGLPLAARQGTRVWLYHKPAGLVVTEKDPEGRPTIFEAFERLGLPRVLTVGRLDINTEGLLLLTNDGGLKRVLELPTTGWLRRYRVRAHGTVTQTQLDGLKDGIVVDGVKYGPIQASLEREQGSNVWLLLGLREGKNREVKNVLGALGLEVNRLIRISFGPFQLGDLAEGAVEMVKSRLLRDQLGKKLAEAAGADFESEMPDSVPPRDPRPVRSPRDRDMGRPRRSEPPAGRSEARSERAAGAGPVRRGPGRFEERDARPRRDGPGRAEARPVRPRRIHFDEDGRAPEVYEDRRDRPSRERDAVPDRPFAKRPARSGPATAGKPFAARADRPAGDRPARPPRPGKSFDDRPKRSFGDKPQRTFAERPARRDGPPGGKPFAGKPGGKPFAGKPFADKPRAGRPTGKPGGARPGGKRPTGAPRKPRG